MHISFVLVGFGLIGLESCPSRRLSDLFGGRGSVIVGLLTVMFEFEVGFSISRFLYCISVIYPN